MELFAERLLVEAKNVFSMVSLKKKKTLVTFIFKSIYKCLFVSVQVHACVCACNIHESYISKPVK